MHLDVINKMDEKLHAFGTGEGTRSKAVYMYIK